ncbi:bacteriocin immunity protein [Pseudomonas sp. PDM12]|uniref:bacteriocin immunity protein n=1 Tax=Pseudomonas sp. PDM12 TaxID=2769260 RepID=UPI00177C9952|nr:bacteriocin immunity protein [Pseudomonas sp. PDM12]MBD9657480.1 bacteriocin immunity protein [Pseudomonas sp. PDM12]
MSSKLEEFTEAEFLEFVEKVCAADFETEEQNDAAVRNFVAIAEHPSGTDLLFYPAPTRPDTPEGIVQEIKEWRAANGKPLFKRE